ncbi:MAG: phytanoyl-CoA dioxygenase family protein [Betaproteobacteria bacterium]|nr:phytanoyl-CoA dioxygenase family protein [Betaproteobacteria bacterium]
MNREPVRAITEEEVQAYQRDGAVCLRQVFDQEWVERLVKAVDRTMANPGKRVREATKAGDPGRFHSNTYMWRWDPDMRALALESPMIGVAQQLMHADRLAFFYDQLFVKEPGTTDITHWHHDLPYWPMAGEDIVSIWLALTPVSLESSGLQYVAGSHQWGRLFRAVTPDEDPRFTNPKLEPCPDYFEESNRVGQRFLSWDLQAGDVICHHPLTIHGAAGNKSPSQRRIGVSLRYTGRDARWDPREYVMRVEGEPEKRLKAGDAPILDDVFPLVWERGRAAA